MEHGSQLQTNNIALLHNMFSRTGSLSDLHKYPGCVNILVVCLNVGDIGFRQLLVHPFRGGVSLGRHLGSYPIRMLRLASLQAPTES